MTKTKPPSDGADAQALAKITAERDALIETAKRAMADLDNAKKRMEEERLTVGAFAKADLVASLLPSIDNFIRAAKNLPENLANDPWTKGILHIEKQLLETLKKHGLEPMEEIVSQPFDPAQHEAVLEGPGPKDTVVEELERGYAFNGSVLRPAKVKVGNGQ